VLATARNVEVEDRLLIDGARRGDPSAERRLYDAHVERVYRLTYRLTGEAELAEDCTQEAFIRAFQRLHEFRGDAALSTWLYRIAVSVTLNRMKQVKRFRSREAPIELGADVGLGRVDAEPDLRARLQRAIDELPEKQRVVFVMYDVEGYTHEEIGAALGIPVGTSKGRLSDARGRLRAALSEFKGEWVR
jgi:RNA polymerase sigma-70 factor (ECF subfamily)